MFTQCSNSKQLIIIPSIEAGKVSFICPLNSYNISDMEPRILMSECSHVGFY